MFSAGIIISITSANATSWKGGFLGFREHFYTFPFNHVILPPKSVCDLEEPATLLSGKVLTPPTPSMTLGTLPDQSSLRDPFLIGMKPELCL